MQKLGIKTVCFVPLSGLASENIFAPSAAMPWAAGGAADVGKDGARRTPTLLEAIDELEISRAEQLPRPFRVMVDESLKIKGVGHVVCGVVTSGSAKIGDDVVWGGDGRPHCRASIKSIENFHKPSPGCKAGDMVGLALRYAANCDEYPAKGDVLGAAFAPPAYGNVLDLEITVTAKVGKEGLKSGCRPVLVLGTSRVTGVVTAIAAEMSRDGKAVTQENPTQMMSGKIYLIQLNLAHAVPAEPASQHARLSRVIMMIGSTAVAIGRVKGVRNQIH